MVPICWVGIAFAQNSAFSWDFHGAGWFNTVVPGGGEFIEGNWGAGFRDAGIELGTFGLGYGLSRRDNFTLDGVPVNYPALGSDVFYQTQNNLVCVQYNPNTHQCVRWANRKTKVRANSGEDTNSDATVANTAALLQEVGIKYHMVNVYDAYRKAWRKEGGVDPGQGFDERPLMDMFKDPFNINTLTSPWVWIPLVLAAGGLFYDYRVQADSGLPTIQRLNWHSNVYMGFNQLVTYPIGSAVPEEAFYRGFIQNEAYYLVRSPFFSIAASSLAFAFSHEPEARVGAAGMGAYLGLLTYKNEGNLSESIAVHFWSVFMLGMQSMFLTLNSQAETSRPVGGALTIAF